MKKQIKHKCFSFRTLIIFYISIAATYSGCRKQASADTGKIQGPTIIYTDINPDSAINGNNSYNLDLDNDGTYDFNFNAFSVSVKCDPRNAAKGTVDGTRVSIPNGSNNGIIFKLNPNYSACLDSLTIIDSFSQWSYVTSQALSMYGLSTCTTGNYTSFGNWYMFGSNQNKYMGLKLMKSSNAYYGWVRLYLNISLRKLIIRDYAYNSRPGQPILAGQNR